MQTLDFETLENERLEHVSTALTAMSVVCKDKETTAREKIDAAKVIAEINHAFVHSKIIESEAVNARTASRAADKLVGQLDKLMKQDDEE